MHYGVGGVVSEPTRTAVIVAPATCAPKQSTDTNEASLVGFESHEISVPCANVDEPVPSAGTLTYVYPKYAGDEVIVDSLK